MICHESDIINECKNFQYLMILKFEACGCLWAESFSVSVFCLLTPMQHHQLYTPQQPAAVLQGYTKASGGVKKPLISAMWVESVVGGCLTQVRGGKIWTLNSNSVKIIQFSAPFLPDFYGKTLWYAHVRPLRLVSVTFLSAFPPTGSH